MLFQHIILIGVWYGRTKFTKMKTRESGWLLREWMNSKEDVHLITNFHFSSLRMQANILLHVAYVLIETCIQKQKQTEHSRSS